MLNIVKENKGFMYDRILQQGDWTLPFILKGTKAPRAVGRWFVKFASNKCVDFFIIFQEVSGMKNAIVTTSET